MIHLYTGDGKGKTTAAMGLALRAAGRGKKVVIVQFLKGSDTGELYSLDFIPNITVLRNRKNYGFFHGASKEIRSKITEENNENLNAALTMPRDLLVLDEICAAWNLEAVDREAVRALLRDNSEETELALTGRDPPELFYEKADYVSEIKKVKHPFERGVQAREGIEY